MKLARYVALDAATSRPVDARTFPTIDELELHYAGVRPNLVPWRVEVDIAPPPLQLHRLGPDDTLIVQLGYDPNGERDTLNDVVNTLEAALGDRWLIMFSDGTVRAR